MTDMEKKKERKTVLVVEDDVDVLDQHRTLLQVMGYDVAAAETRRQAVELLENLRPHLAVLDLMLEDLDAGFTLAYEIKKRYPDTPVIMVTGVTHETGLAFDVARDEERSWIKVDAILGKPVRAEQLKREIERLVKDS